MSSAASVPGVPPTRARANEATQGSGVWGSQIEPSQAAMLDTLLSFVPSVMFARATTFVLRAAGYQVLDSPATSALKAACDEKPQAASLTLGSKTSDPWILSGPTIFSGRDFSRMGLKTFYSLTDSSDKKASIYLPFFTGTTQGKAGTLKINPVGSPLYKFPTRLVVNILDKDELECRMEWQGDLETCKAHNTAVWVMQDRYLNQTVKLSPEAVQGALPGLAVNALQCRLNIAKESSGSLWFPEQPENVTPFALGLAYSLTVAALPVFSSSKTDWSAKAWEAAASFKRPSFQPDTRVDYLTIFPKYTAERHTEYLKSFARGFDDVEGSSDWRVWAGLAYQVALPKELAIGRSYQLSDSLWSFNTLTLKTPSIMGEGLSVSLGLVQKAAILGLDSAPVRTPSLALGPSSSLASLHYAFSGGHVQCVVEGLSKFAAMAETKIANATANVTLSVGVKYDRSAGAKKLSYGGGASVEL